MSLTINTNASALLINRTLSNNESQTTSALNRLSSGNRLNSARDDASALAISSGLNLDLASFRSASTNVAQGASALQIADGGLEQIGGALNRLQTLATTAQSGQISDTERDFLNTEFQNLIQEVDRIADATEFNGIELLGGDRTLNTSITGTDLTAANGVAGVDINAAQRAPGEQIIFDFNGTTGAFTAFVEDGAGNVVDSQTVDLDDLSNNPFDRGGSNSLQAGDTATLNFDDIGVTATLTSDFNAGADLGGDFATGGIDVLAGTTPTPVTLDLQVGATPGDQINASLPVADASGLGLSGLNVSSVTDAQNAARAIGNAVEQLSTARADVGASLNRLEFAGASLSVQAENVAAANSELADANIAEEATRLASTQVRDQAGVALLAQANQQSGLLLRLLQ